MLSFKYHKIAVARILGFEISILLLFTFFSHSFAITYYVKPSGNDNLAGTSEATAWQHIDKANLTLVVGDTVLIMGGTYDEISAVGGCTPSPCGTIRPANSGSSGNYITYKGHPDYPMPIIKGGSWNRYACDLGSRNYITIDGLEITESFRGAVTNNSNYIVIQNCKIHDTAGPTGDNSPGILIGYVEPAYGCTVRNNICYRNWEWQGGTRGSGQHTGGILAYRASNCLIENNVIYDQEAGYGIFLKWYDTTFVVRNNLVYDVNVGIGQGADGGWHDFYENIIYNTGDAGIVIQGNSWNMKVWNNTIWNSAGSGIKLYPFEAMPNFYSRNNIVANCHGDYGVGENWTLEANNHPGLDPDYNCYFDDFENIVVHWHGTEYTLAQYRSATGLDQHSIQANPMFVNPPNDFHLQSGSPCKATGQGGVDMGAYPSAGPDTTPPVISNVQSTNITYNSVTISWTTNEPATSRVEYGLSTSYGSSTTLDPNLVTNHSQNLTGLASSTLYHYRVRSRDQAGNERISSDYTFTTTAQDTTPPVISNVQSTNITYNSATISWTTNELATSQVDYGLTTSYGSSTTFDPSLVTNHSQNLTGLASSTLYHFRVRSRDQAGNERISSDYTFTTTAQDTTPPVISNVQSTNITYNSATISWTTNEPATSRVEYGLSTSYGSSTTLDPNLVTSHSQNLTGLASSTLYHYRVRSKDQAGNERISSDYTFTSLASPDTTPPVILNVQSTNITFNSTTITWTTNEPATSRVEYGLTTAYGSTTNLDTNLVTSHSQDLTGLTFNTLYHYRVRSRDQAGNERISSDYNFTTIDSSTNLATGIPAGVDGTYPGYNVTPITEGIINPYGGTATTWASDEDSTLPHWIIIDFGENKTVNNVTIFWSWNSYLSEWMTPRSFRIQRWDGSNYLDADTVTNPPVGSATVTTFPAVTTSRIRVLQPANMGPIHYSSIVWLTELEIYGLPDTTAPIISNVQSTNITYNSATIGWTTNEPATSRVEYGLSTSYGSSTTLDANLVTSHSQGLTGLSSSTLYHYRVRSKDQAGNERISSDYTFTTSTAPDTTPPVISNVQSSVITYNSATITWTTNESATSQVNYGLTTSYGSSTTLDPNLVTSHSQGLTGLSSSTLYHYRVRSKDQAGNERISSDYTFTTSASPDTTPPVISNVQSTNITYNSATIGWTTNEPATSRVEYGLSTSYGSSTTLDPNLVTSHSQNLTGLASSTLYHYRVRSKDQAGNERISSDYTFTTLAPPDTTPPVISNVQSTNITYNSATIGWTTNEPATSRVEYGLSTSYGSSTTLDPNLVTNHSQNLTGLSSSTLYHYRVRSRDQAGNERISSDYTFTTLAPPDTTPPVISLVRAVEITRHEATIIWTTNEPATSLVQYGLTTSYGSTTTLDTNLVINHSQRLTGLHSNTLYHYRVRSKDAAKNEAISPDDTFRTARRPIRPRPMTPPEDSIVGVPNPVLVIVNGIDSLGFALLHLFQIDTTINFNSSNLQQSTPLGLEQIDDSTTGWTVPQELAVGKYYWRAYAYTNTSPSDTSDPSLVFSFWRSSTDAMDTVYQLTLEYPSQNDTIPTLRPTLVARLVSGGLETNLLSCQFEISEDLNFAVNLLSSERITFADDRTAQWEVTPDLKSNARFYWRAKLWSGDRLLDISEMSTMFTGAIHVFPNPFKPSLGHSRITFSNIPLNSSIRVTTISGDLVKTFEGTQQAEVVWDVKGEDQTELASGVYLYWVSHAGRVFSGKIFVIR